LLLFAVVVFCLVRFGVLRLLPAIAAIFLGYFIAKSQYSPVMQDIIERLGGK
jgi:hypothetical protein